jgi:CO dehydrogenase maturation factor
MEKKSAPVFAVDADANANLHDVLGVEVHTTIGALREESLETIKVTGRRPGGMSVEELFDYHIHQSLIEAKGFDLLVMGRPEGAGCYCAANNFIRKYMDKLANKYPYTVMDNEAGLEHLSRRTTEDIDLLMIISDPSVRGVMTAGRITALVKELGLNIKRAVLIVNRVQSAMREDPSLLQAIKRQAIDFAGFVSADDMISDYDLNGRPLITLPAETKAVDEFYGILGELIP